jgi:hypothetical protein
MTKHMTLWLPEPEEHDYPAAESYLSLHYEESTASLLVIKLRGLPVIQRKAKDIFRASGLPLLPDDDPHVRRNLEKMEKLKPLSPLLLVRARNALIVADGYHRLCAMYHFDYDAEVPCKII